MGRLAITLLALLLAVTTCQGQDGCWTDRHDKSIMQKTLVDTSCKTPRDTIIQLPIPEGYDMVYPSAALAKRCTDLTCTRMDRDCVATKTSAREMRVAATKNSDPMNKFCTYVPVVDHLSCGCKCEKTQKDCGDTKVFNAKMCRCDCPPKVMQACEKRMEDMSGVMWDSRSCHCPCNNRRICGSGEVWAYEKCRCVQEMPNEI